MGKKAKDAGSKTSKGGVAELTQLPAADRTFTVSVPAVLPPPRDDCWDGDDGRPRKLTLSHHALLQDPVFISAIDNFLTPEECVAWIEWGEAEGFEEQRVKQGPVYAARENGRILIESEDVAHNMWLRMKPFVPVEIEGDKGKRAAAGCSPRIRVYRYTKGQRFGQHVDGSCDEPSLGGRTHFTVLAYLNGGLQESGELRVKGGATVFYKDTPSGPGPAVLAFPPTKGCCLFHGHGDECMTHEGAIVEDGVKYVLRTDVVYKNSGAG